ncbi:MULTISPECIES: N-acetylmuramic acid 6-phosphate etherase [Sphingopyxis]|jgi:N-acetylmuramic acid 6-phosphate etherase|uniref:Sugar isomerase (SIS) n=1 Tax=Sphingopyxis fribergensis TaxID=1515612 RepID=A0A0A7PID1_9SPHN|nr:MULTISPECIES: N-acetylmuramic acid 6-phosphate etherase [Sphingopyxis]AJA09709.1 sugar isomerase (SIS) [Sphingopyxis fribergensis]MBR2172748.1 N-acetylmuramic acid 6-phosphate etherase [Sphingopyxis sp.]MDR7062500.1 N-acetylmuramic acid 6-phosphate etherase [Sphingopyxis sp. BE235]MDR7182929.1 N-acetylmuramic acid 6-phosphate etherase [Sphingopyxis sp. BE249]
MPGTEAVDPRYAEIDDWPTVDAVTAMIEGQREAIEALNSQAGAIATACEAAAQRLLSSQGRLIYVGAGTSGRVAVQDGVELTPTFGWPQERLLYLLAGGLPALVESAEGAEDDVVDAARQIAEHAVDATDVVVAVAASGHTPFTLRAIEDARVRGALTIAIANNASTPVLQAAQHAIFLGTGSEIISGSTRMKAGTAQKAAINIISTTIMLRLGKVYRGQMVDMVVSNAKLQRRAAGIVQMLTKCSEDDAVDALERGENSISRAVLIAMGNSPNESAKLLKDHGGILAKAIAALG